MIIDGVAMDSFSDDAPIVSNRDICPILAKMLTTYFTVHCNRAANQVAKPGGHESGTLITHLFLLCLSRGQKLLVPSLKDTRYSSISNLLRSFEFTHIDMVGGNHLALVPSDFGRVFRDNLFSCQCARSQNWEDNSLLGVLHRLLWAAPHKSRPP